MLMLMAMMMMMMRMMTNDQYDDAGFEIEENIWLHLPSRDDAYVKSSHNFLTSMVMMMMMMMTKMLMLLGG